MALRHYALLVVLLLSLQPASLLAQAGRAELFGAIRDSSGLPVPGAAIQAEDQATMVRYSETSDERGEYHLVGLPASNYVVTVEQPGFRMYRQSGITLRLAERTVLDVALQVGQTSQTVEVTAATPVLQTASGEVSMNMDEKKVTTLPLDGRNFVPLVTMAPGVALPGGGSVLPRINGSRPRTNEYMYDGISVLQPEPGQVVYYPIIDGIAEFKLNVNAYSPEYGRSNGGTVMVLGKSGTNQFHGSVFEFFRNEALNARNLFAQPGPKPEYRRNIFGGTIGGPIQANKTFFFGDWQGTRLRTGVTRFSVVPTLAQRQGIFTQAIFDPSTPARTQFPNNTIPSNRFDPIGVQVLQHYPLPNVAGANNFVRTATEPDDQDQADFRIDRYFGKHRFFARYTYFRDDDTPVTPLPEGSGSLTSGVIGHAITRGDAFVGDYSWTLSPSTLNQFRVGYSRRDLNQASLQNGGINVPGLPPNSFGSVLPIFTVAGFQQIGPTTASNSNFTTSITEFLDTFTMVRGRHSIKFGADIRREALDVLNPPNPTGAFSFTTTGTNNSSVAGSGNAYASLLLGQVNAFTIDIQNRVIQERAHIAEFFLADDWKVSPRLNINIGTRYTLNFPSTEVHNQGAVFNLSTQVLDFPHTARNLECCDFGPRVGLAYRIGNSWVVRAGYGVIFFEQSGITTPFTMPQFPFIQTVGQQSQDNLNAAFTLSSGPTVQVTAPNPNSGLGQGVFGVDRTNGSGYSQQRNLTIGKTLRDTWNIEMAYLGSKNTRLGIPDANINQLPTQYLSMGPALLARVPNPYLGSIPASSSLGGATITEQQLLRPFPRFTTVALFRDNVGNSSYNAFAVKLEKRLSRGFSMNASYTFSKLLDDASSVFSQTIFTGPVLNSTGAADAYNRHLEKDVSSGDIPQVFALGWTYDIPRFWKISGVQIAGLIRLQSGNAVPVTQATNNNSSLGFAVQRPNRVADPNNFENRSVAKYFDTSAFTPAGPFVIGSSSRNPVRGPGLQNADLMIGKTFPIREKVSLDLRAEAFNVTNTPPLGDPNGSSGSPAFGSITTAGNPRVFELVGKIHF